MIVSRQVTFDAAHYLPNYEGKCKNLHGHTWKVEIAVEGPTKKETGMVVDFAWLKKVLEKEVVGVLDHSCLNERFLNPTAETIAKYIFIRVMNEWIQGPNEPISLEYVRVWETRHSMAEYNIKDWEKDWVDEKD